MTSYEQSCYFFEYEVDMGAHIPLCSLSGAFEPQNCNKQCATFISGSDVFKMVKDKVEKGEQMATFEQHNIRLVGAGETIETEYDGKLRRLQKMFVCPYKDTVKCPRTDLFYEDDIFVPCPECNMMSPVIYKRNGQSVCAIVVDLNEPTLMETLNNIGDLIKFRNEKENKNV